MKNIFHELEHNTKEKSINLNNTISCYHRPHLNYFIRKKNKNQKKIKTRNINNNFIDYKEEKGIQLNKKEVLTNNSFAQMNNSFENIISNKINKEQKLFNIFNINNKNIYITNLKYKNNNKILINNSNHMLNKSLFKINKKPSISKDIATLCKIINSINDNNDNNKLCRNKNNKYNNEICHTNPNEKITYKYFEGKIIKIQRWWRRLLYHLYIENYILMIQRQIRKYLKRKKNLLENKNRLDIIKIILIQKAWKKYMTKKCLHNYYFFSFKKYIKPKKNDNQLYNIVKSNLIHNINRNKINKVINCKNKKKNYYISKIYYRISQIDNINQTIIKLQKVIKQFLYNKRSYKYKIINNNLNNSNLDKCYIKKENNFDLINLMKKTFTSYISFKLSRLFILLLNRINLFYFIKIIIQRIKKNINYFVLMQLFNIPNKTYNSYSFFFQTIWRHIKINLKTNNEISSLLKNNIPKFFKKEFHKKYIPYITPSQEHNLLNIQLFINNNNDDLINYIFYFFEKEKNININISRKYIINHLNKYNLKNKNIFYITRYIDSLYNNIIKTKFKINDIKENINDNEYKYYIQTEEINCNIDNNDIWEQNYIINRKNSYEIKHLNCKFMSYLDKNNELKK